MTRSMKALLILSSLAMAAPVSATTKPDGASFTIDAGAVVLDHDLKLENAPVVGARFGYDFNKWFGAEGRFTYLDSRSTATPSKPQAHGFAYRLDTLGYLLPDSQIVPYVAAGVGEMSLRNRDTFGDQDSLLLNYGLGAKFFVMDSLALRLDARHLITFDNNEHSHGEFTFGVNYYFGGTGSTAKPVASTSGCPMVGASHPAHNTLVMPSAAAASPNENAPASVAALSAVPATAPVAVTTAPTSAAEAAPATVPAAEAGKEAPAVQSSAASVGYIGMLVDPAEVKAANVRKPRPAAHQTATTITGISRVDNGVRIHTNRAIKDFRVASLVKPTRLYVDVYTSVNGTGKNRIAVNAGGIADVRVAQYPNKTRVVFDFPAGKLPRYKVVRTSAGLDLLFDKAGRN